MEYEYYSTPVPADFEVRSLLVDNTGPGGCVSNDKDGECVWNAGAFTTQCPAPGLHWFNVTCYSDEFSRADMCYYNENGVLGCLVDCKVQHYLDVTLVYNVTTSDAGIASCTVSAGDCCVWYDGGDLARSDDLAPGMLDCVTDDNVNSCTDTVVSMHQLNNITLRNLPAPQKYWWTVECTTTPNAYVGRSVVNWTFTLL